MVVCMSVWYAPLLLLMVLFRYVKLCKDVGFIGPKGYLTTTDADLIFQRTKRSGNYGKRICYEDFRSVLSDA